MPLVVRPQHPASAQSGTSGYSGWSGTGFSGPPGPSGQSGYSGPAGGPSGVSGFSGYSGADGQGTSGTSGYSGADGQGTSGTSGYSGADGQGTSGTSGYSGDSVSGVSGYSGASVVGLSGSSGTSGTSGFSGYSGADGQGTSGTSGYSGDSGSAGDSGVSGYSGLIGGGMTWVYKNAAYVAVDHEGILADTSVNPWTLTLPVAPAYGDSVGIIDQLGTFDANNLTVDGNGANIQGVFEPLICDIQNMNIELVYTGATDGWKVRTFPGYVSGISGYSGDSGYSGYSGDSTSGYSGYSSASGVSGYSGPAGGASGYSGYSGLNPGTYTWVISNPVVGGFPGPRLKTGKTALRVDSYTTAATNMSFDIEDRTAIGVSGVKVMASTMTAGVTGATTTAFSAASMSADHWLWIQVTSVSGACGIGVITLAVQ